MISKVKVIIRKIFLRNSTKVFFKKLRKYKIYLMSKLSDENYVKLNIRLNTGIKLNFKKASNAYRKSKLVKTEL